MPPLHADDPAQAAAQHPLFHSGDLPKPLVARVGRTGRALLGSAHSSRPCCAVRPQPQHPLPPLTATRSWCRASCQVGPGDLLYLPALWFHRVSQARHAGEECVVAVNMWWVGEQGGLWGAAQTQILKYTRSPLVLQVRHGLRPHLGAPEAGGGACCEARALLFSLMEGWRPHGPFIVQCCSLAVVMSGGAGCSCGGQAGVPVIHSPHWNWSQKSTRR